MSFPSDLVTIPLRHPPVRSTRYQQKAYNSAAKSSECSILFSVGVDRCILIRDIDCFWWYYAEDSWSCGQVDTVAFLANTWGILQLYKTRYKPPTIRENRFRLWPQSPVGTSIYGRQFGSTAWYIGCGMVFECFQIHAYASTLLIGSCTSIMFQTVFHPCLDASRASDKLNNNTPPATKSYSSPKVEITSSSSQNSRSRRITSSPARSTSSTDEAPVSLRTKRFNQVAPTFTRRLSSTQVLEGKCLIVEFCTTLTTYWIEICGEFYFVVLDIEKEWVYTKLPDNDR